MHATIHKQHEPTRVSSDGDDSGDNSDGTDDVQEDVAGENDGKKFNRRGDKCRVDDEGSETI